MVDEPNPKIHKLSAANISAEAIDKKSPVEIYPSSGHADIIRNSQGEEEIDLYQVWLVLNKYRLLLVAVMILSLCLSLSYVFFATPVFRSEIVVAPVTAKDKSVLGGLSTQFGSLASLAGVDINAADNTLAKQLAGLESRAFIIPFLEKQNLLPILFADKWDAAKQTWKVDEGEIPTLLSGYRYFTENVMSVNKAVKTGLITLSIDWEDAQQAADWANELIAGFNEYQRKQAIQDAEKSIGYLTKQQDITNIASVQDAISRLIEAQTEVIMLANVKQDYALQVLDPALPMEKPLYPNKVLVVVLGCVSGIFLGLFSVFLINFFREMSKGYRGE